MGLVPEATEVRRRAKGGMGAEGVGARGGGGGRQDGLAA